MAIIRVHAGADGASHFEEIHPKFQPLGDQSESADTWVKTGSLDWPPSAAGSTGISLVLNSACSGVGGVASFER